MPNIELHGYGLATTTIKEKVRAALKDWPEPEEVVTTTYPTEVEDLTDKKLPFLRIIAQSEELPGLKERLGPLNEDMEVMPLGEWIPKK